MADSRDIILAPIVTEKTNAAMAGGKYAFYVAIDANRSEIKRAVEEIFKVKVKDVNTMRNHGKTRRMGRFVGRLSDWKKAIVTLEEGQKIAFFEGMST